MLSLACIIPKSTKLKFKFSLFWTLFCYNGIAMNVLSNLFGPINKIKATVFKMYEMFQFILLVNICALLLLFKKIETFIISKRKVFVFENIQLICSVGMFDFFVFLNFFFLIWFIFFCSVGFEIFNFSVQWNLVRSLFQILLRGIFTVHFKFSWVSEINNFAHFSIFLLWWFLFSVFSWKLWLL